MIQDLIDENLTKRIAYLARLSLTDAEVKNYTEQLKKIVDYVLLLQELDLTKTEVFFHTDAHKELMREDEIVPFDSQLILKEASQVLENCFKVPQIL